MATNFQIRHAASVIQRGGVITCPTDTIYGLSCDPYNPDAIKRLFAIKQRTRGKSMIILAHAPNHIAPLVDMRQLPGDFDWRAGQPTTWVMPASDHCPHWLRHTDNTVAARLTDYPLIRRLCRQLDSAIISTSANLAGMPPVRNKLALRYFFQQQVDAMLFCNMPGTGKASTIKHYQDNNVIRHSS